MDLSEPAALLLDAPCCTTARGKSALSAVMWWPCSAPRRPAGVAVGFSIASAARLLRAGRARVAFSASLVATEQWSHQGPFADPERLVFRKVTTNIGDAYDPGTGEPSGAFTSWTQAKVQSADPCLKIIKIK